MWLLAIILFIAYVTHQYTLPDEARFFKKSNLFCLLLKIRHNHKITLKITKIHVLSTKRLNRAGVYDLWTLWKVQQHLNAGCLRDVSDKHTNCRSCTCRRYVFCVRGISGACSGVNKTPVTWLKTPVTWCWQIHVRFLILVQHTASRGKLVFDNLNFILLGTYNCYPKTHKRYTQTKNVSFEVVN